MPSLKQTLADLHVRHTREILEALAGASHQDLQDVLAEYRGSRSAKSPTVPRIFGRRSASPARTWARRSP